MENSGQWPCHPRVAADGNQSAIYARLAPISGDATMLKTAPLDSLDAVVSMPRHHDAGIQADITEAPFPANDASSEHRKPFFDAVAARIHLPCCGSLPWRLTRRCKVLTARITNATGSTPYGNAICTTTEQHGQTAVQYERIHPLEPILIKPPL